MIAADGDGGHIERDSPGGSGDDGCFSIPTVTVEEARDGAAARL